MKARLCFSLVNQIARSNLTTGAVRQISPLGLFLLRNPIVRVGYRKEALVPDLQINYKSHVVNMPKTLQSAPSCRAVPLVCYTLSHCSGTVQITLAPCDLCFLTYEAKYRGIEPNSRDRKND